MTQNTYQVALERRYNGPLPPDPAAWLNCETSWQEQIQTRRQQTWQTVRQAAQSVLAAKRDFRHAPSVESYRIWRLRRRALSHALAGWAAFRDLDRREPNQNLASDAISAARSAR